MGFFLIITMLPMMVATTALMGFITFAIFWGIAALLLILGISGIVMNAFQKRAEPSADGGVAKKAVGTWRNAAALILSVAFGVYPILLIISFIAAFAA